MDNLHLYNSLSRRKERFEPLSPPFVGMYVCGPTVYGYGHLGHARSAISFDTLFRYLTYLGYKVRYVRNITDVGHLVNDADEGDSKVEKQARVEQLEPMEIAQRYANAYIEDMTAMNLLRPSIEPRATGHIPEQIEVIERIIANGYAYVINGSVYFDVARYDKDFNYGKLSGRDLENMFSESRVDLEGQAEKRNPADFALWKKANPNHIMRWNSPWGIGFPGWHIECTVMSTKYLGEKYDIHGGGMDLLFPHHEAEIAQTNACHLGAPAEKLDEAKYWLHNNMITYEGQKMGKSLGNAISLREFFSGKHPLLKQAYSPMVIRFFILQAHYRSTLDFSNDALQAAEKGLQRMLEVIKRLDGIEVPEQTGMVIEEFEKNLASFLTDCEEAMNDDMNTAKVIARMFESFSVINQLFNKQAKGFGVNPATFVKFREAFHTVFGDWLGLLTHSDQEDSIQDTIEGLMSVVIDIRTNARKEKNWAVADLIRNRLGELNIKLEDKEASTEWYYEK